MDAIICCDQCGRAIRPDEMSKGEAIVTPATAVCSACASSLTPEQRAALLKPPGRQRPETRDPRGARTRRRTPSPIAPRDVPRVPAAPPDFPEFEREPEKGRTGRYVKAGLLVLASACVVGFVLVRAGKRDGAEEKSEPAAVGEPAGARTGEAGAGPGTKEPEADKAARAAHVERIRSLVDGSYGRYGEIQKELEAFLAKYPEDEEALALRAEVDEGHGKLADEAFARASSLARRLAGSGFEDQAVGRIRSVAERFGDSAWYRTRGEEAIRKVLDEIAAGAPVQPDAPEAGPAARPERPPKTTASPGNAVTNSGFEILDGRGMPVGWSLRPGVVLLEEDGNHFVRVQQLRGAKASTFFTGRFKLNPRWSEIHVSCRMRARNLRTGGRVTDTAMCLVSFQGGKGGRLNAVPSASPRLDKSSDWIQLDSKAAVPKGAEYVVLKPGLYRSLGTLAVDDVTVGPERARRLPVRVSAPEARPRTVWDVPGPAPATRAASAGKTAPTKPSGERDIRRAREALRGGDFAGARRALEARKTWRESDLRRAEKLLAAIDEAERSAGERKRLLEDPYTRLLLGLLDAARGGIPAAEEYFRRERARVGAEHSGRVEHLSKRIREADLVAATVAEGLAALKRPVRLDDVNGGRVSGRVEAVEDGVISIKPSVGEVKTLKLVDVAPEQLVDVTRLLRHGAVTKRQLASFAYILGDLDAAARWAAEAKGDGVGALREDIEMVRAATAEARVAVLEDEEDGAGAAGAAAEGSQAGGVSEAELLSRVNDFFSRIPEGGIEGLYLTPGAVFNLARRYDGSRVAPKKLAAVGGAVAGSSGFNSLLKKKLPGGAGYVFTSRSGIAGRGKTVGAVLKSLGKFLDREKPEFVRVCFDATDLAAGRSAEDLRPHLTKMTSEILHRGAMPVLFTLAVPPPTDKVAYDKVSGYNDMVTDLAAGLNVPCVDAWIVLNTNPGMRVEFFHGSGVPTKKGYDAVNSVVLYAYRALENLVAGRKVPMPVVAKRPGLAWPGATAVEEEEPPPAGNLVKNGGFEEIRDDFPRGWRRHNWGAGGRAPVRSDRLESHEGERSLQIRSAGKGSKPGAFTKATLPEGAYEVRFWATADVGEAVNVHVRHGDPPNATELPAVIVTGEWKPYKKTFNVLKKEAGVSFGFCISSPGGRVWIDDVELEYVGR